MSEASNVREEAARGPDRELLAMARRCREAGSCAGIGPDRPLLLAEREVSAARALHEAGTVPLTPQPDRSRLLMEGGSAGSEPLMPALPDRSSWVSAASPVQLVAVRGPVSVASLMSSDTSAGGRTDGSLPLTPVLLRSKCDKEDSALHDAGIGPVRPVPDPSNI